MNLMVKCAFLLVSIANFAIAQQGQRPPVTQRAQAPQGQQEARYLVLID